MPSCLKCGAELAVNEEGIAPVLCDRCAGKATSRARRGMRTGTFRDFPATTALLAINLAVFAGMVLFGGNPMRFSPQALLLLGNYGPLTLSGEYWRFVTAGFVHSGLPHLAFNMWALWSLGRLSERLFGSWITFAVYMLTGVGGSMLSVFTNSDRFEVGASGAIFGIAGAILSGIRFGNVAISSIERRAIFSSLTFFIIFNLAIGFGLVSVGIGIDNMCHLGGLITGLVFGVPLATASASGRKSFEWATIVLVALAMSVLGSQLVNAKGQESKLKIARIEISLNDYAAAIATLESATAAHPNDAQAQGLLGRAYEMNNQRDKAIAAYERALRLDSNLPDVRQSLEQLQAAPK